MNFLRNDPTYKERRRDLRKNQTDAEKAFWIHVRNRRFHGLKFFRQYSVGAYILDFYCPERKLAVELDGGQHNDDKSKEYDTVRSEYLRTHGIDVLRFWNHEVLLDVRSVFAKLGEHISPS
jgi:very-short-patch-repair endonuclease